MPRDLVLRARTNTRHVRPEARRGHAMSFRQIGMHFTTNIMADVLREEKRLTKAPFMQLGLFMCIPS